MISRSLIQQRLSQFRIKNPDATFFELLSTLIVGSWRVLLARIYLRSAQKVGKLVSVNGKPIIGNLGEMYFADEVRIWSIIERSKLYTGKNGKLVVGRNSRLNGVHIDARELIQIGDTVQIGPYTIIMDSDFHDLKDHSKPGPSKPIIIEDDVWIATRVTILKGVRIGKGSVIAAGSIVTKDVPPYCVAAGTPARIVKRIE
ncbi:MAG: acyltransferase [Cyclobacteriaceae bacterium]|nr:acyltransferase [Cyclobacteriaceae bacterium]